ncbi:MAG TPA: OmpP1/FadL family transporter [Thermoanaerobaculia bacterium]|nr:OmpP1/FadL family transporter [Thermoanaerobaculia bacterium]
MALSLTSVVAALGSGFQLFEQGGKAVAMGGAFAATADDPSALYYNPAGLAQQRRASILVGGTAISFTNQFTGDPNDEFTAGTTGHYRRHIFVPPNAYAVVPIGSNLTFGIGMMTPFGLRTNWANPWIGRFQASDSNVKTVEIEPALAWQTSDGRFALGGGPTYRRSHIVLQRNNAFPGSGVDPFTGRIVDVANVWLNSDWNSAWGWNLGVMWKPSDALHVGASYRSQMDINYTGEAVFTQISTGNPQLDALVKAGLPPNQPITTKIPYPATMLLGVSTGVIPNWTIEADIDRTTWSRFKALDVNFSQTPANNLHRPENWKDTTAYRLGANHPVTQNWDVRFGLLYDENPQPTYAVSALLPDANRKGVTFGAGYHGGPWIVDWTVFVLHFDTRGTFGQSQEGLNGSFKTDATLMSLNFGYRFGAR